MKWAITIITLVIKCIVSGGIIIPFETPNGVKLFEYQHVDDISVAAIHKQLIPFCTKLGLQNFECDKIVPFLQNEEYKNIVNIQSFQQSNGILHHLDSITLQDRVCLEMQLPRYCGLYDLTNTECQYLYYSIKLEKYYDVEKLDSCPLPFPRMPSNATGDRPPPRTSDHANSKKLDIWMYWDTGVEGMNPLVRFVHRHNLQIVERFGHRIHLLTLSTLSSYVDTSSLPTLFWTLSACQQADLLRVYMLHRHGGIWLDCDIILVGDVTQLFSLLPAGEGLLTTEEFNGKVGNAVLAASAGSPALAYIWQEAQAALKEYAHRREEGVLYMHRDFLGPALISRAVKHWGDGVGWLRKSTFPVLPETPIVVLPASRTGDGMHFSIWTKAPAINLHVWLMASEDLARQRAESILRDSYGLVGLWTLADASPFLFDVIAHDSRSIFAHLFRISLRRSPLLAAPQSGEL